MSFYKELEDIGFANGGKILLPEDNTKRYPVLYLIHGLGGIGDWLNSGSGDIKNRMEDLISRGKISPMILVMPQINNDSERSAGPYSGYDICGLMNYVNRIYADVVSPERKNTGIVGVSMGASAAIYHAVKHTDKFIHLAALGPATVMSYIVKPNEFVLKNDQDAVHYIGYGTAEGNAFAIADRYVVDHFKENGVNIIVEEHIGTGHNFESFGPLLENFLSIIFKN